MERKFNSGAYLRDLIAPDEFLRSSSDISLIPYVLLRGPLLLYTNVLEMNCTMALTVPGGQQYSQEYVRRVSLSIAYSSLILLPVSTTVVILGCGSPFLIPLFKAETGCCFPVFTDPHGELHMELGMICSSNLGLRPEYQRNSMAVNMWKGFKQSFRLRKENKALQCSDRNQVGGEFLFEPLEIDTPSPSMVSADVKVARSAVDLRVPRTPVDGEDKMVSWCYRMRHARDHVELPELREVLGMKGNGGPGNHPRRWERALRERKGVGKSWMRHMERWHMDSYLNP